MPATANRSMADAQGTRPVVESRVFLIAVWLWFALALSADAGTVRLKNGLVLTGKPSKLESLTRAVNPNPGPVTIYQIILVQTAYQRYFVPMRQVPDDGLNLDAALVRDVEFTIPWHVRGKRELTIQMVGGVVEMDPWDNTFGRRTVSLQVANRPNPLHVVQAITKIAPDHVLISSVNHTWDFGLGISLVPQTTIVSLLQNPQLCDPNDSTVRMARARFYIQAGWYAQADAELAAYARDFPDLKDKADTLRQGLVQLFGAHVLRELERRRDAGQFQLGDESAEKLLQSPLGGGVQRNVQQFLYESRQAREAMLKAAALLNDLQAQLADTETAGDSKGQPLKFRQTAKISAMRAQLLRELDRAGLSRLQPFLQAETDAQLSAEEKLALAYSGWVLGPDAADSDLDDSQHLWDARNLAMEYLRSDDPAERSQVFDQLRLLEGLGPKRLQKLLENLPPIRDADGISTGRAVRIELAPQGDQPGAAYWVLLPPEYSPNHNYPCVLALHAQGRTGEQAAMFWGGTVEEPGWCQRRGYIVIAPEYAGEGTREYTYGAAAHSAVMQSLRDARLRFAIDPDRVFLTGHDMGADAAFDIGLAHADEFAGVIPIAGVAELYSRFYIENGTQTAWYVVRGELGRDSERKFSTWADRVFNLGAKYDFIYVQFAGRGQETYADELSRIVDWMDLHRRGPTPREVEFRSLRQIDNQSHWVTAVDLPKTVLLQAASGDRVGSEVMKISCRINEGNTIYVKSPAKRHRIRLIDGVVDFDRKIGVNVNGKTKPAMFVQPDMLTLLEDFRFHGDRRRIAAAVLEY